MNLTSRFNFFGALGLAAAIGMAGCHSNQQNAENQTQEQTQEQTSGDPAAANVVPVAAQGTGTQTSEDYEQSAPTPEYDQNVAPQNAGPEDDTADESAYGVEPDETAQQAPPPLPDYDQPPVPGDGYMWTPGYWGYAPTGYYWVPGAWVEAPYEGALWTPGYWAFANNRYVFYHGYWGPHVGFYGGVNYGFGYTGYGYRGGYWRGNVFNYNRSVNNVNVTVVRNVYNYRVEENRGPRVSFNGGRGGVQVRPRMGELAALREAHAGPMSTQVEIAQQARNNHGNFYAANRGRPAQAAFSQPVRAVHVRPAVMPVRNLPEAARPAPQVTHYPQQITRPQGQPNRPEQQMRPEQQARPEQNRPEQQQVRPEQNRPEQNRPQQQMRPEQNRPEQNRPEQNRPQQQMRPQQNRPEENQPQPQVRPEQNRPQQQMRPEQSRPEQNRPQPQARPEQNRPEQNRPQQQARPEQNRPEPQRAEPQRQQQPSHAAPQEQRPEPQRPQQPEHKEEKK